MWISINVMLVVAVCVNATKRKATVKRADLVIPQIKAAEKDGKLTLTQKTLHPDGSLVTRWSQQYRGIPVWNGQIAQRESKSRTVNVIDECTGKTHQKFVQGYTSINGWYVPDLEVDEGEIDQLLNDKERMIEVTKTGNGLCPHGQGAINRTLYITDDGDVEPAYHYYFESDTSLCHFMIALNLTVIKRMEEYFGDQGIPGDAPQSPVTFLNKHTVEVIGNDEIDENGVHYRFVSIKHMGRDHKDRFSEGVPETLPKWKLLKVQVRDDVCFLKNNQIWVFNPSEGNRTVSFDCKHGETTTINERPEEFAEFDLFANGNFVVNFVKSRYGTDFVNSSTVLQMFYFSKTKVGASMGGEYGRFSIQQPGWYDTYPNTVEDVAVHEMAHAFTQHHGDLKYYVDSESGGLNEAFSDITVMNPTQQISWHLANRLIPVDQFFPNKSDCNVPELPLRYMNNPSRDCYSIGHVDGLPRYTDKQMDPHSSSGVFNHAFYFAVTEMQQLTACQPELQIYDAFFVANRDKYTKLTRFDDGAAAELNAAEELLDGEHTGVKYNKYLTLVIKDAFAKVGIECERTPETWICDFDRNM